MKKKWVWFLLFLAVSACLFAWAAGTEQIKPLVLAVLPFLVVYYLFFTILSSEKSKESEPKPGIEGRLAQLDALRDSGAITAEECETRRRAILDEI